MKMLSTMLLSVSLLAGLVFEPAQPDPWTGLTPGVDFEALPPYSFYRADCDYLNSNQKLRNFNLDPIDPQTVEYLECGLNVPAYGRAVELTTGKQWVCLYGWEYMAMPADTASCIQAALLRDGDQVFGVLTGSYLGIVRSAPRSDLVIYPADRERLAWLVDVEVRGFGQSYWTAGLSVLSTVFERMETRKLSDGTIRGTLGRCSTDGSLCQFPAWITTLGCKGVIDSVCPLGHTDDLILAREVVGMYLDGYRGLCDGYLYYDSMAGGHQDCAIEAPDGSREQFHNQ